MEHAAPRRRRATAVRGSTPGRRRSSVCVAAPSEPKFFVRRSGFLYGSAGPALVDLSTRPGAHLALRSAAAPAKQNAGQGCSIFSASSGCRRSRRKRRMLDRTRDECHGASGSVSTTFSSSRSARSSARSNGTAPNDSVPRTILRMKCNGAGERSADRAQRTTRLEACRSTNLVLVTQTFQAVALRS